MVEISNYVRQLGEQARAAAAVLARTSTARKNEALHAFAVELRQAQDLLLDANEQDLRNAQHLAAPLRERLNFGGARGIAAMAESAKAVAALPDPVGEVTDLVCRPSGIQVGHMRVPLGVIAIIYESRPNVTVEAATLCLKSGNAAILRGGSESLSSNRAIAACLTKALAATGLHPHCVQVMDQTDRALVGQLVQLRGLVDLIIPRGGRALLERLQRESAIPLLMHLDGNCHVYVDESADLDMASKVVVNAKTQRLSTCNTLESLLVARSLAATFLPKAAEALSAMGIELRCCPQSLALLKACGAKVVPASEEDWYAEYLAPILSMKVVSDLDEAIAHINRYSSHHTDAIITSNLNHAQRFLREVDSSSVMVNASTRFADGFEYGLGAEIGISTDKLHARGPVGLTGLTSKKWVVLGEGHIRE